MWETALTEEHFEGYIRIFSVPFVLTSLILNRTLAPYWVSSITGTSMSEVWINYTAQNPNDWDLAIIIPIFKEGYRLYASNYCSITFLSGICTSKRRKKNT